MPSADATPLDTPVWSALNGRQRHLGTVTPRCAAYRPEVSPFAAFASEPSANDWDELAALVGSGREIVFASDLRPPAHWSTDEARYGFQMTGEDVSSVRRPIAAPTAVVHELGLSDVDDMLALIDAARPGPFAAESILFGDYIGIRDGRTLVAMVGTRFRVEGATEVSVLATHPDFRGRGFGERLFRDVAVRIVERGELPFLHVADGNPAIRLYEALGFRVRRNACFTFVRTP